MQIVSDEDNPMLSTVQYEAEDLEPWNGLPEVKS